MQPNNIDDLFRDQLNGHATPPGEDVWARLAAGLATEKDVPAPVDAAVDRTFRAGLGQYASPVRRELWERLEDEHLRPRQRRAAAWWPLALAASLALLLVGGAGWWLREGSLRPAAVAGAGRATQAQRAQRAQRGLAAPSAIAAASTATASTTKNAPAGSGRAAAKGPKPAGRENNFAAQNRASRAALAVFVGTDGAAAGRLAKKTGGRATQAGRTASNAPTATDNGLAARPAPATSAPQTAVPSSRPDAAGAALAAAAASLPAPALASPAGIIEVEVRPGRAASRAVSPAPTVALANPAAFTDPQGSRAGRVLGGLLRQAHRLAQGEPLSLADATGHGPAQTLNLQARVAGHTLTKSIQL